MVFFWGSTCTSKEFTHLILLRLHAVTGDINSLPQNNEESAPPRCCAASSCNSDNRYTRCVNG